jgi:hypothetical protein
LKASYGNVIDFKMPWARHKHMLKTHQNDYESDPQSDPKVIFWRVFGKLGDFLGARGSTCDAGASFWQPLGTPLATMVAACDMLDSMLDVILEQTSIHSGIRFK